MFHIIYQIENTINGKIYVGAHSTIDLNDGYMGSSKVLVAAMKKYGKENFQKTILHIFKTSSDMYLKESEIVNQEFVNRNDTYNVKLGGIGGWHHFNSNKDVYAESNTKRLEKMRQVVQQRINSGTWMKPLSREQSIINRKGHLGNSPESIKKKKETFARIDHAKGQKNSQYGTVWIHSLHEKISKKIKLSDLESFIQLGWIKGRKIRF